MGCGASANRENAKEEESAEGHESDAELAPLPPSGSLMHLTEHRGITLVQLNDIVEKLRSLADTEGVIPGWFDRNEKKCKVTTVNLYDVVKYLVEPATRQKQCSYVELVAPAGTRAQTPKWFVSHWWGEPVMDFIACVEEHAKVRALDPEKAVYWVCAYAAFPLQYRTQTRRIIKRESKLCFRVGSFISIQ